MDFGVNYHDALIAVKENCSMEHALSALGYDTAHRNQSGYELYHFRFPGYGSQSDDKNPSLRYTPSSRTWVYYGAGYPDSICRNKRPGGSIIDFVLAVKYGNVDGESEIGKRHVREVVELLAPYVGRRIESVVETSPVQKSAATQAHGEFTLRVDGVSPVTDNRVFAYATKARGILPEVLKTAGYQANYSLNYADGHRIQLAALAFPNLSVTEDAYGHGLSFRMHSVNRSNGREYDIKRCTGSDITLVKSDGSIDFGDLTPSSPNITVFEGFMDYLSWLSHLNAKALFENRPIDRLTPRDCDVIVLNSTANAVSAAALLGGYRNVRFYLDNDDAGRECLIRLADERRRERGMETFVFTPEEVDEVRRSVRTRIIASGDSLRHADGSPVQQREIMEARRSVINTLHLDGTTVDVFLSSLSPETLWASCLNHNMTQDLAPVFTKKLAEDENLYRSIGMRNSSTLYAGFNDFNDFWRDEKKKIEYRRLDRPSQSPVKEQIRQAEEDCNRTVSQVKYKP